MNDPNRPVTGYPAPNQNGHPAPPPPAYGSGPPPAYFNNNQQPQQPYYANQNYYPDPYAPQRATFLRRILGLIIVALVIAGTIFFIIWLILRPSIPEFRVDSFTVSKLNVSSSPSSFTGDFNVHLTVRNPNKKLSVSYDQILAAIYYRNNQISQNILPPFTQPTKNETAIQALFSALDTYVPNDVVDAISTAKGKGTTVGFNLMMVIRVGFKSGAWRARNRHLRVLCGNLSVGFAANGANGTMSGGPLQCKVGF